MNAYSAIITVGGLGLFLLGIHHLTEGLKGLAGDSLRRILQALVAGRLSAIVSGALFTVAIQSSTATTLTVIGFVSAGLVTFAQAVGVIIGATFGTRTSGPIASGSWRMWRCSASRPLTPAPRSTRSPGVRKRSITLGARRFRSKAPRARMMWIPRRRTADEA